MEVSGVSRGHLSPVRRVIVYFSHACLVCGLMYQSTAMVISRRSINLTTLFPGQA